MALTAAAATAALLTPFKLGAAARAASAPAVCTEPGAVATGDTTMFFRALLDRF
jgi:hypothetical protein